MTQVESMIMKIIWDNDGSISTSELIEKIRQKHNKDYARTTAVTFLDRLKKKGYITKTRKRNISYAIANINEHDYKLELLSQQLEFWFNGDANEMLRYINIWHDAEKEKPEEDKDVLIAYCSTDEINDEDRTIFYGVSRYYEDSNFHFMKWHPPIEYFGYYTVLGWTSLPEYLKEK